MDDQVFITKVVNHTSGIYQVVESNGEIIVRIAEGGWMTFQSQSPYTTYARWDKIHVYKDRVELDERPDWKEPDRGQFVLDCLNKDGGEVETRDIGNQVVALPRHIPVKVSVELGSPWIWYQKLEIRRVWERQPSSICQGYFQQVPVTKDVKTPRSTTETLWIKGLMLARGIKEPRREEPQAEEGEIFQTVFENKSDNPVKVWADNGRPFFSIGPGQRLYLEAYDPKAMYARFRKVTFKKDGRIDLEENSKWKNPFPLSIELINEDGCPIQAVTLGGQTVSAVQGIPRYAEVKLAEQDVLYKRFIWRRVEVKVVDSNLPGYFEKRTEVQLIKEARSEKEIEKLRERRAFIVQSDTDRRKSRIMAGR